MSGWNNWALKSSYILIGSQMEIYFSMRRESAWQWETLEGGRSLWLCFSLSPASISPLLSLPSPLIPLPPKPTMALLSATFSWTSFSQKLHRIQKRLWWDISPPLFCGSYFLDWKSNLHATLEVLLQDYFLKWRQPIFFSCLERSF